jgi:hypothetical protein
MPRWSPGLTRSGQLLLDTLDETPPGKAHSAAYQDLCRNIFALLFCPPLDRPISESSNATRINRRDLVLPNYAPSGFWAYMRSCYEAHLVVIDAKNLAGKVKKNDILQIANYLSPHGTGLFGIIASRNGCSMSAELTRQSQWMHDHKMIIVLDDDDLHQMINLWMDYHDPTDLIRRRIQDFRLSF